jgi:hypothetical protein
VTRYTLLSLILLVLALPTMAHATDFGPGEAAAHANANRRPAPNADFLVLVWYHRNDPLGTFKYEVYDLRRERSIALINQWVKDTRAKFPAYIVSVNDVDLKLAAGSTESLKVGSVIQRELTIAAARAGIVGGRGFDLRPQPGIGIGSATVSSSSALTPRLELRPGAPAGNRSTYSNAPTFPFPLPSVRRPP